MLQLLWSIVVEQDMKLIAYPVSEVKVISLCRMHRFQNRAPSHLHMCTIV